MNTIEIADIVSRHNLLRYLSLFIKDDDMSSSPDMKNFMLIFKNDNTPCIAPSYGEFHWIDKETRNEFTFTYMEEGKPVQWNMEPGGTYFKRMKISHPNLPVLKEFVTRAITHKEKNDDNRITIYNSCSKGYFNSPSKIYAQDIETGIYIPKNIKDELISHIDHFLDPKTKARYIRYGRDYKLGFMLAGQSGSGKSSVIKAIAAKYDKPIYVFNFSKSLTDEVFISLMREIKNDSIILFEDIDAFFVDREPVNINISFSALLNIMDGVFSCTSGCITFITANNPDRLDSALIRPGRIDKIIRFEYPRKAEIKAAFNDIVDPDPKTDKTPDNFEEFYSHIKNSKITMAGIIDYLFRYHHDNLYIKNIDELLNQTQIYHELVNDKTEKLYS
jgi:ATPase family associated with various cellular activities (AAA)